MSKRKSYSIEEKANMVMRLENGESNSNLIKEFNISHSTLSTMWKNRDQIKE